MKFGRWRDFNALRRAHVPRVDPLRSLRRIDGSMRRDQGNMSIGFVVFVA
jgi:hypothetical protein